MTCPVHPGRPRSLFHSFSPVGQPPILTAFGAVDRRSNRRGTMLEYHYPHRRPACDKPRKRSPKCLICYAKDLYWLIDPRSRPPP